ncbi:MAG TPA: HAMP domain-containing sensor histidine kinase [Polyangiaceae bacterium]|nr:HAMP domain-containing sensor histidine kinase [Polyangiaceae bacterium]
MNAAPWFAPRVLLYQATLGFAVLFFLIGEVPSLLRLDPQEASRAAWPLYVFGAATILLSLWATSRRLARLKPLLKDVAARAPALRADDIEELAQMSPFAALASAATAGVASLALSVPVFYREGVDKERVVSLLLLEVIIMATASLPLYVLVRNAVARVLEAAAPDGPREALERVEQLGLPRKRVVRHMFAAVAVPVFVVATGTLLVTMGHLREVTTVGRVETALALAHGPLALDPERFGPAERARLAALLGERGFHVSFLPGARPVLAEHDRQGRVVVALPIGAADERAVFTFDASPRWPLGPAATLALALAFVLALGAWVGLAFGRALAGDLETAARQVRALGGGAPGPAGAARARFAVVAQLGQAASTLAERFRTFADAQKRAVEAREASLRLRDVLFASVSHDLKGPLNAILGFCAVASAEPLSEGQLESVNAIERRARELLALIETILDAARVEAGHLTLVRASCSVATVVRLALERGDDLGPLGAEPVRLEASDELPQVHWDDARMVRALGAVVAYAKRLSPGGGVVLRAKAPDPASVELTVLEPSAGLTVRELMHVIEEGPMAFDPQRVGGLALGLPLADAIVTMHGGKLEVLEAPEGGLLFRLRLPVDGGVSALTPGSLTSFRPPGFGSASVRPPGFSAPPPKPSRSSRPPGTLMSGRGPAPRAARAKPCLR